MHIRFQPEEVAEGRTLLETSRTRPGPIVLIAPHSAIGSKDLDDQQVLGVAEALSREGYCPVGLHTQPIRVLNKNGFGTVCHIGIRQWMSVIQQADYLVSVDTAAAHCAGGLGKPAIGIFTWADGYVYCKHYPSVTIVQRHRDTHPNWTCGPCYHWFKCQKSSKSRKPCVTELTVEEIMEGFWKLVEKK
jgi:ADP-heptose:LPS heptosyltransferase